MQLVVSFSQIILYIALAILFGTFILTLIPEKLRPSFFVSKKWVIGAAISIPIATFIPVLYIIIYIAPRLGVIRAIEVVLTQYTTGIAWSIGFLLSSVLIFLILYANQMNKQHSKGYVYISLFLLTSIVITIGWASHASAINVGLGIISDSLHLLAASIWVGILFVVTWFNTNTKNWLAFLKWFTLVAISCLAIITISGFLLLDVLVDDYINAWMISYGQGLFLKHLFIVPMLFYAAINGIFVKFMLTKNEQYNPLRGAKVESLILLVIFIITAIFSQSSPPHGFYLTSDAISPLFTWLHHTPIMADSYVAFISNPVAIIFIFLSMLMIGANIAAYFLKAPVWTLCITSLLLVASLYTTFMLSVGVQ